MADELPALLAQARTLDPGAWDALYQRAFPHVYRFLAARVRSVQEAEDLTEEVFLGALQSASKTRATDEPAFMAWLFQIARYKLADRLRAQYRRPSEPLANDFDAPDGGQTPEDHAVQLDEHAGLRAAMSKLTNEQQDVLMLKYVLEYDNLRAAAVLKKSSGAINQLQHRALNQLRKLLGESGKGI